MQYTPVLNLRIKNTRMSFKYWISFVCFHILPYRLSTVYFLVHYIGDELTELLFQKYCHICKFPYRYGNIFFRMPAFLSEKLFHSCRLFELMQAIHTSAVRCCFCRVECHLSQNCCCDTFLFAAYHITHLHFYFYWQYTLFYRLFLFNVEIPTQHVIFSLRSYPNLYLSCASLIITAIYVF